jgi:rubrerythrin
MTDQNDIARYRDNFQKEIDGAALYRALADAEKQPQMAKVYSRLAASEEKHAEAWQKKLEKLSAPVPPRKPSMRAAVMIWLAKRFGPQFVLPTIANKEYFT